jgi:4-carboxymuconolactone decarboxylase
MARVRLVEKEQAPPMVKDLYEKNEAKSGRVLNLWKVMGNCPYVGLNFQRLGNSLLRGEELPARLRELAVLRVAYLAGSEYEFKQHSAIARESGVTQRQIDAIPEWAASAAFTDEERAVLQYTDEVAGDTSVRDDTFERLRGFLGEHAIVELTTAIGYWRMAARILVALEVDMESE